jgi:hypothetical protein
MIKFSCAQCKAQYEVDDSQAGSMGQCTSCKAVMRVPAKSTNIFQIFKGNEYFSDKKLNALYSDLLNVYESKIVHQSIHRGDNFEHAEMEIRTEGHRTQVVMIFRMEIGSYVEVGVASKVGEIATKDDAVHALRSVDMFSGYTVSLDKDNELWVSHRRLIEGFTALEFAVTIDAVAKHADTLEKEILGRDDA